MSASADPLRVVPVEGRRAWARFERVSEMVLGGYPQFVPPIPGTEAGLGKPGHPFHRHGSVMPFVAFRGARPVGRVAAIVNRTHNAYHGDRTGFVGFFDCEDDTEAAAALLGAAEAELTRLRHPLLRGPFNPTQNDPCGVLVDGFQHRPAFLMPWNPPYYERLWLEAGWTATRDLLAYYTDRDSPIGGRVAPLLERFEKRFKIRVRPADLAHVEREMAIIHRLFNETLRDEWNFMPLHEADLADAVRDLRRVLDGELILIAEEEGRPVGFFLAIPDLNDLWKHAARAPRPFRLLRLAWAMHRGRPRSFRVAAAGVLPGHRAPGLVVTLLLQRIWAQRSRYQTAEISFVQEGNVMMRRLMEQIGVVPYKTYRIYEKSVGGD